jgi:hypothetical protein
VAEKKNQMFVIQSVTLPKNNFKILGASLGEISE